ncbi:UDP-glycosyltransferase 83A1-like isoform X2 [Prosopis cineraria]|uniref:UDP-glycosyltransferase 83A1-like isoform X2 n=1 Tax=Prosopis cineraria TaxID=364024 RepID=UPI00240F5695|nr:UDP-glycosyltransferase 83A1-like isoform X2 [Prosopis cineraria]
MKAWTVRGEEEEEQVGNDLIQLVSIPDGLEQEESKDRRGARLMESMWKVMPKKLEKLIQEINESDSVKITCVIADGAMGWALEVAEKMGIHRAVFWSASALLLAMVLSITKLLHDGIIDSTLQARKKKINCLNHLEGSLWPEDSNCLNWLDLQQDKSIIYVAFGSIAILDHAQLQELALGLKLSNKPFLWVVRSGINNEANYDFLKEFEERLSSRGKVVGWASSIESSKPSFNCLLLKPLWLEFYLRRCHQWSAFLVLAFIG